MQRPADCRIVVNCQNERDSAVFRYADVAQTAKMIIQNCIDQPDPTGRYPQLKWGGVAPVGENTFYVAVAHPIDDSHELGEANLTAIGSRGLFHEDIDSW